MSGIFEKKLADLGIVLAPPPAAVANYVPFVRTGNLVFVSGQLPLKDGNLAYSGKLGAERNADEGYQAARLCAINIIAQAKAACGGDLDRLRRVVRIVGFVASAPDFTAQPKVVNGASDLLVEVFGEAGRHARAAVGAPSLPLDASVEIEAVLEVE